jgi:uncharacterized GH25 family protein
MKHVRTTIFFGVFLLLLSNPSARGHDGWVEATPTLVERGQSTTLSLKLGNHSNMHHSYRLAGKWDPKYTTLTVIGPSGAPVDLSKELIDLGEDEEQTGPKGPKGFHIAGFQAKEEGVYLAVAREEKVLQHGKGPRFRGIRTAKSAFAVLSVPTVAAAKTAKGYNRPVAGKEALEIIPLANPLAITQGDEISLEVRYKGKPVSGKVVSLIRRLGGPASAQLAGTDCNGRVNFTAGPADFYLARVKFDERSERAEGNYDLSTYEATYVFQVFNRP